MNTEEIRKKNLADFPDEKRFEGYVRTVLSRDPQGYPIKVKDTFADGTCQIIRFDPKPLGEYGPQKSEEERMREAEQDESADRKAGNAEEEAMNEALDLE